MEVKEPRRTRSTAAATAAPIVTEEIKGENPEVIVVE
jgi:hypothetical protein